MCSEDDFMKILAIADLHAWSTDELHLIADCDADVCCLLGDIPIAAIEVIKQLVHCPIYNLSTVRYMVFSEITMKWTH